MIWPSIVLDRIFSGIPTGAPDLPFECLAMPSRTSHVRFRPRAVVLERVDDPQALLVMVEAARHERVDHAFAGMAERRMTEVVTERDGFGQLFVQAQDLGDRARDLRHLEGVRQPRAVVITRRREEHLGLVFQSAKRLAVNDPIAITLERRPDVVFPLGTEPPLRVRALGGLRRQNVTLPRFELLTQRHRSSPCDLRKEAGAVGQRAGAEHLAQRSVQGRRTSCECRRRRPRGRAAP